MSLEESMKDLADSNRELAEAQREYTKTIREYGTRALIGAGKPAADADEDTGKAGKAGKAPTAAEKKAAEKKAAAEAAKAKDSDDGFGDEEEEEEAEEAIFTHDQVKALLVKVKNAAGDKEVALDLIRPHGYQSIPTIQEKDFAKIAAAAEKWLKKNG